MTDFHNILRLQEEQQQTLKECELMIEKWEKYKAEYVAVDNLLSDLPKKTTHEIMVPIGPLAFMPGHLIHTNEITVLLGDNWFAERSAVQASEIAKRRMKNVEDQLKNLQEEYKNIQSHIAFTTDIANVKNESDFKEIKEELSEKDKELLERKKRRVAHSKATKDSVKKVDLKSMSENICSTKTSTTDNDLFTRLEELERQERMNNEMNNVSATERKTNISKMAKDASTIAGGEKTSKSVKWKESIAEEKEVETVAVPLVEKATIKFTHSAPEKVTPTKDSDVENRTIISSPADIFTDYLHKKTVTCIQPRSILKQHSTNTEHQDKMIGEHLSTTSSKKAVTSTNSSKENSEMSSKSQNPKPAFSNIVVEHKDVGHTDITTKQEQPQETRKISKFKARRMKNTTD